MTDGKPKREQPWSIRGVPPETREAAGIAAKRAGLPLGPWLDRVVRDAAAEQLTTKGKQEVGPTQAEILAQVLDQMQKVNQRLDQAEQKAAEKPVEPQFTGVLGRAKWLFTGKPGSR